MSDTHISDLTIDLGQRSYDVLIGNGLFAQLGKELIARFKTCKIGVVTDNHVAKLYLEPIMATLQQAGLQPYSFIVPAGENSKSLATFSSLTEQVIAAQLERNDILMALGGGVVGDLTGYVAASVRRGIRFVQAPTTLLAQVDSAIGGKTGINSQYGKNLIGAFYQPSLVLADTQALNTLPERELRAGYAEIVKYGLINDADFFRWLEANHHAVLTGNQDKARIKAIATSCRAKAAIVAKDEKEHGQRALLNLGHTFAHALEAATGYGQRLNHGEAVAIGLILAHEFSAYLDHCTREDAHRIKHHLTKAGLPTRIQHIPEADITADSLFTFMQQDKKVERGALNFVLSRGIGRAFIARDVPKDKVLGFLATTQA